MFCTRPRASRSEEERYSPVRQWGPSRSELLPSFGMLTAPMGNKDGSGRPLPAAKRVTIRRLMKWDKRAKYHTCRRRNLNRALWEISRISSPLGLKENVKREAALLCRKLKKYKLHGRPTEELVAAMIYAACRLLSVPRTLHEISGVSGVSKKDIGRSYRFLVHKLSIAVPTPSPADYVPRFASKLNLPEAVAQIATELARESVGNRLCIGHAPEGIAAGAIYVASQNNGERRTQMEISAVTGVADATTRAASRAIKKT